jgi:hypothetical protein
MATLNKERGACQLESGDQMGASSREMDLTAGYGGFQKWKNNAHAVEKKFISLCG